MNPKHNLKSYLFILTALILIEIPRFLCQDRPYETCSQPFRCGNIGDISYPFYGGNRPLSCGYPGFELDCSSDVPRLNIESLQYQVLSINNDTQTVRVARDDLSSSCPSFLLNTTLDFQIFNYNSNANDRNITLFYGCPLLPNPHQYTCSVNGSTSFGIYATGNPSFTDGVGCTGSVFVTVNETAERTLANSSSLSGDDLVDAITGGFTIDWYANTSNCEVCARSGGFCGYEESSSSFACYCSDRTYPLTCRSQNGGRPPRQRMIVILVSALGLTCIVIISVILICRFSNKCTWNDPDNESNQVVEKFILNHGSLAPKRYRYDEIKKVTKSFAEKLGQGGFGTVYKGVLPDGRDVAVKFLKESKGNGEEFISEVASISRTSHVNIVNLLGFCFDKNKRALVYEFMPNKSLDEYINQASQLEWKKLYDIAIGVARGLEYLHRGCNTRIVHFDIKPQNILLDEEFRPKISDFGLAKLYQKEKSILTSLFGTRGTIGYIAPEVFCRSFGAVSHKSDVYSYGMMVLEMAGAKKVDESARTEESSENYFPDKIYEQHIVRWKDELNEIGMSEEEGETLRKMFLIGFWCIQTVPSNRPSMSKVVEMFERSVESIQIPPKPFLSSPIVSIPEFSSSFAINLATESLNEGELS